MYFVWELNGNSIFSFRPLQKYVGKFYKQWMRIIKLVWCEFSMKYSTDWFPILYLHSNIPLKLQRKNIEPTLMALSSFSLCGWKCLLWPAWNSTSFQHNYFPMVSEWLCLCFRLFFRMEPCYLLMVNQDPVLFSLTQRMKFFRAVLVVIKIDLTKLFYAIISVVYYQWQKPNYYTNITHLTYTMLVLRWFSRLLSPF